MQIHYAKDDPFKSGEAIEAFCASVKEKQGSVTYYEYDGAGHLFTDKSLPGEYDEANTRELWKRVIQFCSDVGGSAAVLEKER